MKANDQVKHATEQRKTFNMPNTVEQPGTAALLEPLVRHASSSSWARRLSDGRCLVISIIDGSPMPIGVNDVVIQADIAFGRMRDETDSGRGQTFIDIIETGWKPIGGGVSFADAVNMVGG